jgi:putative ABC transport system permease protein
VFPVGAYYALRTGGDAFAVLRTVRGVVLQMEPDATIENVATMRQIVDNRLRRPRMYLVLLGIFAATAIALAVGGIYGVMAHAVARRTRDIGIRRALGASAGHVVAQIVGNAALLTGLGIVAGLLGAAALTRSLASLLFGIQPLDATTFAAVALLFAVVGIAASLVPARRAMDVDPLVAIREP